MLLKNAYRMCYINLVTICVLIICGTVLQKKVIDIREQLSRLLKRLGIVLQSCERDTEVWFLFIIACFVD